MILENLGKNRMRMKMIYLKEEIRLRAGRVLLMACAAECPTRLLGKRGADLSGAWSDDSVRQVRPFSA